MYIPLIFIMTRGPPHVAPSPWHSGVQRISGFNIDYRSIDSAPTRDLLTRDRPSSFSTHYHNIQGLNTNFPYVETHPPTSLTNLFLLSETQLSGQSSPDPFQISQYNLYSYFSSSKGGICAYCNINTRIARLMDLESPHFDVPCLKMSPYNYYHSLL